MTIHPMPGLNQQKAAMARRTVDEDVFPASMLLAVAAFSSSIAVIVAIAVYADATIIMDQALFDFVHVGKTWTPTTAPLWWNEAVRDLTSLGGTLILTGSVFASCIYLLAGRRYRLCALLLGSSLAVTLFSATAKLSFARARPQSVEHLVLTSSASFPSGHALLSAAIILTIGGLMAFAARTAIERKVIVTTALVVCLGVGLTRIWLGVHWPSDVLAGWMFGVAWAAITLWMAKRIDWQGQRSSAA